MGLYLFVTPYIKIPLPGWQTDILGQNDLGDLTIGKNDYFKKCSLDLARVGGFHMQDSG